MEKMLAEKHWKMWLMHLNIYLFITYIHVFILICMHFLITYSSA